MLQFSNPVLENKTIAGASDHSLQNQQVSQDVAYEKMPSVVFKSQDYCRLELKDFEFDVTFKVVSASVYFSGKNFKTIEKTSIISNSLKPIRKYMDRCEPGTKIVFDDVKIIGSDNLIRSIPGANYILF